MPFFMSASQIVTQLLHLALLTSVILELSDSLFVELGYQ